MSAAEVISQAVHDHVFGDDFPKDEATCCGPVAIDALAAAGYAIVKLPEVEADWHGGMSKWPVAQTWQGHPDRPGEVMIRRSDGRIGVNGVSLPTDSPENARSLAAALLAAADAAEVSR